MTDYRRVIELILEELARAGAVAPSRCGCHGFTFDCCPDRVSGVLAAGATRLGLHASDGGAQRRRRLSSTTRCSSRTPRRQTSTSCAVKRRSGSSRRCASIRRGWQRCGSAAAWQRRRRVLGRRLSAGSHHTRREAVRSAARDLRWRFRDRHGHQRRRAQVRRRAAGVRGHPRRRAGLSRERRQQQGDSRDGAADRRREGHRVHAVEGGRRRFRQDVNRLRARAARRQPMSPSCAASSATRWGSRRRVASRISSR